MKKIKLNASKFFKFSNVYNRIPLILLLLKILRLNPRKPTKNLIYILKISTVSLFQNLFFMNLWINVFFYEGAKVIKNDVYRNGCNQIALFGNIDSYQIKLIYFDLKNDEKLNNKYEVKEKIKSFKIKDMPIQIVYGDLLQQDVDVIVNAGYNINNILFVWW